MAKSLSSNIIRGILLALALTAAGLAAGGCMQRPQAPLPPEQMARVQDLLEQVDAGSAEKARELRHQWQDQVQKLGAQEKPNPFEKASLDFAVAYALERDQQYREAVLAYQQASNVLGVQAAFRTGEIELIGLEDRKAAIGAYNRAAMAQPPVQAWARAAPESERPEVAGGIQWPSVLASSSVGRLETVPAAQSSQLRLDLLQRGDWRYRSISTFVELLGNNKRYSYALALLLIALAIKLVTWPLTSSSFRSIRAMQSLQPLIKELQQKHKGDRQALAAEQMLLFKKHKINPLGGCLPMLIQMPILIGVYQGIRFYIYQLSNAKFFWIPNLAQPDIPLLLMYALSLYVSQKLTTMPQADPQQQQMQNTMTIMMPLMLTVLFASLPAAFILYWFFYNILITGHQYYLMRQPAPALAAAKAGAGGPPAPGRARARRRRKK